MGNQESNGAVLGVQRRIGSEAGDVRKKAEIEKNLICA